MVSKEPGKALFKTIMSCTCDTLSGEVTGGDCTSGWQRMDLVTLGRGAIAGVGCLMVLEVGELDTWGDRMVLEWLELPWGGKMVL